jgi:hypothetical protein
MELEELGAPPRVFWKAILNLVEIQTSSRVRVVEAVHSSSLESRRAIVLIEVQGYDPRSNQESCHKIRC